jgi:hypothetical protein
VESTKEEEEKEKEEKKTEETFGSDEDNKENKGSFVSLSFSDTT